MNAPKMPTDYPPKEEGEASVKRRVLKLIARVYVQQAGERTEGSVIAHSDAQVKLLNVLKDSNQLLEWPGSEEDGDKTFTPGDKVFLVAIDATGNPIVSPEEVALPRRPLAYIEALEAFASGAQWERVKEILSFDPAIKEKEVAKGLMNNINAISSLKDAGQILSVVVNFKDEGIREELFSTTRRKVEKVVDGLAKDATSFAELQALRSDIQALFQRPEFKAFSTSEVFDVLDHYVVTFAEAKLLKATNAKDVGAIIKVLETTPFSFPEMQRDPLLLRARDMEARFSYDHRLRYARSAKALDTLKGEVENYTFTEQWGATYKVDLLAKIAEKRLKY